MIIVTSSQFYMMIVWACELFIPTAVSTELFSQICQNWKNIVKKNLPDRVVNYPIDVFCAQPSLLDWVISADWVAVTRSRKSAILAVVSPYSMIIVGNSRVAPPVVSICKNCWRLKCCMYVSINMYVVCFLWIRGRVVRASSLGSKGPEFDSSVRPSVVEIADHC